MVTAAAVISAVAAVGSLAYGVHAGEEGRQERKRAARRQATAQQSAESSALQQSNRAASEAARARAKQTDILSLMASNTGPKNPATMLTGPLGATSSLGL